MRLFVIALLTATLAVAQPGTGKGRGGPGRGAAPAPVVNTIPCDRACLLDIANQYFAALAAHDPSKAPFAANPKFVENTKVLKPGEGLWASAAAPPTNFKIVVPDPVSEQIGFIVVMKEKAPPAAPGAATGKGKGPVVDSNGNRDVMVGGRLKIINKQIAEAEHLVAAANPELRPNILSEVPANQRESRETLLWAARGYYDALDNSNGKLAPFADDCERHENGMNTTRDTKCGPQLDTHTFDYITVINNRRVEIADPVTGLAIGFSHFRHPMDQKIFKIYNADGTVTTRDMSNQRPFDMPAAHIFKVTGGKIHEIEAVGVSVPYNSPTGWEP